MIVVSRWWKASGALVLRFQGLLLVIGTVNPSNVKDARPVELNRYFGALSIELGNGSARLRISSRYLAYAAIPHSFRRPG